MHHRAIIIEFQILIVIDQLIEIRFRSFDHIGVTDCYKSVAVRPRLFVNEAAYMAQLVQERSETAIYRATGLLLAADAADRGLAGAAVIIRVEIELNIIGL
jgi:hypothetical protein